jgi:uncharacterized protein YkwD
LLWPVRNSFFHFILAAILATAAYGAEPCTYQPNSLETGILDELNLVRKDPPGYAFHLEDILDSYHGKEREMENNVILTTQEGRPVVEEAIRALQSTKPRGLLQWNACLAASSAEHVKDTGPSGLIGHDSSRGEHFPRRVGRYLRHYREVGENIDYGSASAREVVMQLLIDDGVPDRGHRKNILTPAFNEVGVACGPHKQFGTMCVIDFGRL